MAAEGGDVIIAKKILGREVVSAINEALQRQTQQLRRSGTVPTLAILRIGERPDAVAYQAGATKRCQQVGIAVRSVILPQQTPLEEVLDAVQALNRDDSVHGVLMLRPFPKHLDDKTIREALCVEKDVDGITNTSLYGVFTGVELGFPPCTAQGCIEMLDHYRIPIAGKRAVVVGASLVIGRPVAMLLLMRNATVTICHIATVDLAAACANAEIIIAAAGSRGLIGKSCTAPGQIILDVGVNVGEDGTLYGDVDFEAVEPLVAALSPVPGGVGTVTTSILAQHVVQAARRSLNSQPAAHSLVSLTHTYDLNQPI